MHIPVKDLQPIPGVTWIGFGYKARNGKDTAVEAIHCANPRITRRHAFADALKCYARVHMGMTKKDGPLLQRVGTENMRTADPETWIRTLYWTVDETPARFVLVTDCRFENEAEFIKQMGGYLIKVRRENEDGTPYISTDRPADHPSEIALDGYNGWDFEIVNRGVRQLEDDATALFRRIQMASEAGFRVRG